MLRMTGLSDKTGGGAEGNTYSATSGAASAPDDDEAEAEEGGSGSIALSAMSSTMGSLGGTLSVSPEDLAARSGFAPAAAAPRTPASPLGPGAYSVRPSGISRAGSGSAGNDGNPAAREARGSTIISDLTGAHLGTTDHDDDPVVVVAVAHLVEDATCEVVSGEHTGGGEEDGSTEHDAHAHAAAGGASASIRQQSTGHASQSQAQSQSAGGHTNGAGTWNSGTADGTGTGTATNAPPDGVIIAEKLDGRSLSVCGRHGRLQRWHCAVLGGLVLAACVAIPTALVLGGRRGGSDGETTFDWTRDLVESIVVPSVSDPSALDDVTSPQSRAIEWLTAGGGGAVVTGPDVPSVEWRIRQRYCLAVLYYSTNGDGWKERYGYLDETSHECEWGSEMLNNGWSALECNDEGEVTLINLWQNNLVGPLPPELAHLPLVSIDFLTNKISGSLPEEIATMTSLNYLNLGYNRLTGTVPPQLGNLRQLTYLMMDNNDLTGTIPPELGKLTQLSGWLSLEGNDLHGTVPASFAALTNATWIYLNANNLTGSVEFLCDALQPVEGPGYTNDTSTSPLLELWVDVDDVNCTCCNCCPLFE